MDEARSKAGPMLHAVNNEARSIGRADRVWDGKRGQARFSAEALCTLPYAGQEWVELQAVRKPAVNTTTAMTLNTFFIVRSFVRLWSEWFLRDRTIQS